MRDYQKRLWLAYAPPGVWSSGPAVIYDYDHDDSGVPASITKYKEMGHEVVGPYILEGE